MEKGALTFPGCPTFPRWRGSNYIVLYKPIEFCDFPGGLGPVRTPAPSSGSARGIVNWVRPHIVLAKRLSMTITQLMQVLCGCGKQRQGPIVECRRYALGIKNAMSRVVHRVSKAFCAMGSCIIPNVGCEGSLYNVASTYKIPNYPHALSHTVCGDHK